MLAFLPVVYPVLSCPADILDGGHKDCCSKRYNLVWRVRNTPQEFCIVISCPRKGFDWLYGGFITDPHVSSSLL